MKTLSRPFSVPPFYGPTVVRAAFVLALFGWGVGFYGPAVYLAAVMDRTGWSLPLVSAAVTVHFLFGALVVANLPRLYAGLGLPATTTLGAALTALGVLGWSLAQQPWQLFASALCSGAGWVAMGAVAVNTLIARWYVRKRPSALGQAYNGASLGGALFAPLWVALIAAVGFTPAAVMVGAVMTGVVAWLSRRVFARTPAALGQHPDGEPAQPSSPPGAAPAGAMPPQLPGRALYASKAFLTLAAGMAAGLFAQIGLLAHLYRLLSLEVGPRSASLLMALATLCAIGGRSLAARVLGRVPQRRVVAAAGYGIQAAGCGLLLAAGPADMWLLAAGMALIGSGIGNATSLPPLVAQADFAPADVARAVAAVVAIAQAAYAFAPAAFGAAQAYWAGAQAQGMQQAALPLLLGAIAIQGLAALFMLAGRSYCQRGAALPGGIERRP
ncbi:MFS transporter [Orrella sp. JC864]|uniref:MFS transporter n=1 Tax=Orrella sp. JC864 TaxID=3120298 RepID=UPI0012BB5F94